MGLLPAAFAKTLKARIAKVPNCILTDHEGTVILNINPKFGTANLPPNSGGVQIEWIGNEVTVSDYGLGR